MLSLHCCEGFSLVSASGGYSRCSAQTSRCRIWGLRFVYHLDHYWYQKIIKSMDSILGRQILSSENMIENSLGKQNKTIQEFVAIYLKNFLYKLGLEKTEESEIKLPTVVGSWRKQGNSRKTSTSASVTMPKPLTVWVTCKETACNMGDPGSIPGLGRSPGEGLATHSSILTQRTPWTEEPGGL